MHRSLLPGRGAPGATAQEGLETGFFYVVNHGISEEFMAQVFEQSRKFFTLPLEEKMKVYQDENFRGYTPIFDEKLDPAKQRLGDAKEGYYIGREVSGSDPRAKDPLQGPNQWPSPDTLPEWKQTMKMYFDQAEKLSRKLIKLIARALELEESFFDKPGMFDHPMAVVRLLHYPAQASNPEEGLFGAGAHSDYGMLTLLASDGVPGLQICKEKDAKEQVWTNVQPLRGAFVVNLGDMLERWTNNLFRSTLHRVLNYGVECHSIAFFMEPNFDCIVECIPTCCSELNPPKLPPVKSGDHLLGRYKVTHKDYEAVAK
ncbi:2-oxoglutarate-Fe(II) type oxidoreductase hxnY [Selaginella moellendorffii]|nr:2-oxoglutarate-Fe(II) type oxidoreductase hxnY [Selaginella moellendorffii]|eukprot:XP_002982743.2 2-oxoglutarate-Fe(II) type oxidoreductase hxnY [Selaginella moellendorffii]